MSYSKLLHLFYLLQYSLLSKYMFSTDADKLPDLQNTASTICPSRSTTCGTLASRPSSERPTTCCGFCDCGPNCVEYGSCCLTEYSTLRHARDSTESSRYGCVKPQYLRSTLDTDFTTAVDDGAVWMVTNCELAATDEERELCENPESGGTIDFLVPVYYHGKHYRNRFCANCNGISDEMRPITWRLEIFCYEPMYPFPSAENLLQKIKEDRCNIFFRSPYGGGGSFKTYTEPCTEQFYTISECNVTGLWMQYNETVDKACNSYVDAFNTTYKNYFCWLCNTNGILPSEEWECRDPNQGAGASYVPPFAAILDLSAINTKATGTADLACKATQFEDRKLMKCRDILCDSRSHLEDGQCRSNNVSHDNGNCITIFFNLTPVSDKISFHFDDVTNSEFQRELQLEMRELLKDLNDLLEEFFLFAKQPSSEMDQVYLMFQMKFYFLDRERLDTFSKIIDTFEDKTLVIEVNGHNVTFASEIVSYSLALFDDTSVRTVRIPNDNTISDDILERVSIVSRILALPWFRCLGSFPFSKLDVCPYIELGRKDLQFEIRNGFLIINESFLYQVFNAWEFKYGSHRLLLCLADYKRIYDAMPIRSTAKIKLAKGAKEMFALVCVCLSVVCLLVTIIIYVSLTELHSQPCTNTIVLCVTLLLAQTTYQFGAGQTDGPAWSCVVIGAVCHFLWLSVMFAMNVCSYDMFRIFKNIHKLSTDFRWKDVIKRLLYIFVASVLFVVINLIASVLLSNGQDFGYGGIICYLSSTRMQLITFIIPSLLTIITNFVFFGYVVIRIGQNRVNAAKLGHERNYFGIYVRLSTLTGLTWLIGYLHLLIKNDVLEYQFILLNAGQGVFIMVAFVCNRRIYRLVKEKISNRISTNTQHTHTQPD